MPFHGDPLAFYGKLIIENHHASLFQKLPHFELDYDLLDPIRISDEKHPFLSDLKVGILGAGIGGLYTALILDSLDIKYEILEASGRPGGRLSTYHFPNKGKYDYFDEGAMRYPLPKKDVDGKYKNGTMKRLAELTEYPPLNQGSDPLREKLIPYYFKARKSKGSRPGFNYFNGEHQEVSYESDAHKGSFKAEDMGVDAGYIRAGSTAIHDDVISPFVNSLTTDLQTGELNGWNLMKENDSYSIRGYMASKYMPSVTLNLPRKHLSNDVINWCNLLEDSSGEYDHALTEAVFNAFAFANGVGNNDYGEVDWKCFESGSETLTKKIMEYLNSRGSFIKYHNRVTAVHEGHLSVEIDGYSSQRIVPTIKGGPLGSARIPPEFSQDSGSVERKTPIVGVAVNGSTECDIYSHVISTLPLPVLRTIDLNHAGLNVLQRNALRALNYGPSLKIAILFKSNWWTTKLNITGGQSFTDLPIRTIVYPSYGVDSDAPSKVLIASYTWTTDASRLGALAVKENKERLKDLVLRNLAEAHEHYNTEITYEFLQHEYEDMHVKDWSIDEYTMGGYAKLAPGEFENLYTSLNFPAAKNCLHFAGEAVSTRHSWVVGALDSAWRAVYEYLKVTGQYEKIEKFKEIWGVNKEWTTESTLVDDDDGSEVDLLDEHIGLVRRAILTGVFPTADTELL